MKQKQSLHFINFLTKANALRAIRSCGILINQTSNSFTINHRSIQGISLLTGAVEGESENQSMCRNRAEYPINPYTLPALIIDTVDRASGSPCSHIMDIIQSLLKGEKFSCSIRSSLQSLSFIQGTSDKQYHRMLSTIYIHPRKEYSKT